MKKIIREYFTFNKRERNGVFVLLSIIFLLILYLNISEYFVDTGSLDPDEFREELKMLELADKSIELPEQAAEDPAESEKKAKHRMHELFPFDPNHLPEGDWKRLGLSEKQISSIRKFESKGGRFRKKEDLKKMYCISKELYGRMEPFIRIDETGPPQFVEGKVQATVSYTKPSLVDLNRVDSATLITIKGIGPFFARNILKYRTQLGGFISKEQLLEVWKFDREKLDQISPFITVELSGIRKININTCTAAELKHAYLKWNVVHAIVNYRENHGKYKSPEDIRKTDLVDEETYRKIAPYLTVD